MKTLKIFVTGTVQGVFFRQFIKQKANEFGLKGFARNLSDGRVEIIVEGRDENVNNMTEACRHGPAHSDVRNVEIQEIRHQGFKDFKILI